MPLFCCYTFISLFLLPEIIHKNGMPMRVSILTIAILMLCGYSADAQYRRLYKMYEIHGGIGAANVFGDLGGAATRDNWYGLKDIQFSQTRPTLYVAGRMDLNEQFSGKANLFAGLAAGKDAGSINDTRGYTYQSWMFELSGQIEWNFWRPEGCIGTLLSQKRGRRGPRMMTRVYMFVGAGAVFSLPSVDTHGKPLAAGEYTKDNTVGLVVPFGLGARSDINPFWAVGLEIGRRYCTSDYLDGIHTDWSKSNDTYYFTTLHAIYKIQTIGGKRRPPRRSSYRR